jgi:hypothetical protein
VKKALWWWLRVLLKKNAPKNVSVQPWPGVMTRRGNIYFERIGKGDRQWLAESFESFESWTPPTG